MMIKRTKLNIKKIGASSKVAASNIWKVVNGYNRKYDQKIEKVTYQKKKLKIHVHNWINQEVF